MKSINPATEELIQEYRSANSRDIDFSLNLSRQCFKNWRNTPLSARTSLFTNLSRILRKKANELGILISQEMGKPISEAESEVNKCADLCDYFSSKASDLLADEPIPTDAPRSYVKKEPLGTIFGVMPWNFPFWQVFRFVVPSLLGGNVAIVKPAPNVCSSTFALAEAFIEAKFPEGALQVLLAEVDQIPGIIADERVQAVTFTGSVKGGSAVASAAGKAVKKSVLELGGSDPFIVFEDADLDKAVEGAIKGRLINTGQSCIASKRFLIQDSIFPHFCKRLSKKVESLKMGNPLDAKTHLGPIARKDLLEQLHDQVQKSIEAGAELITGGKRENTTGYFYPATILSKVKKGMPAYNEEIFGPVFSLISFQTEEEAIEIANDTPYGLSSSLWSESIERIHRIIPEIQAGSVFVNAISISKPPLPFGGVKQSGYGNELSHYGFHEFLNLKAVSIDL